MGEREEPGPVVSGRTIARHLKAAMNGTHGYAYMSEKDRGRVVAMMEELQRHRDLEEKHFFGEDDE